MTEPCDGVEPLHSAWLDDELDAAGRARVDDHLARCEACRAAVDGLRRARAAVRNLPRRRPSVPPT
ncbi:MAG: zf-HC2 domain-containing protein, partial [Actinobacteria bacterium]|nr:zf-HC2 domain-containing protein [Actinomycetota bacterium]